MAIIPFNMFMRNMSSPYSIALLTFEGEKKTVQQLFISRGFISFLQKNKIYHVAMETTINNNFRMLIYYIAIDVY